MESSIARNSAERRYTRAASRQRPSATILTATSWRLSAFTELTMVGSRYCPAAALGRPAVANSTIAAVTRLVSEAFMGLLLRRANRHFSPWASSVGLKLAAGTEPRRG